MRRLGVVLLVFVVAAPAAAAAATPRFALYDLQRDLAHASRNVYGDVQVKPRVDLAGKGTLVRCAAWCRFGAGWLAFTPAPRVAPADVSAAAVRYTAHKGWTVRLTLGRAAAAKWTELGRNLKNDARLQGVPSVLIVVAGGRVAASPYSTQVFASAGVLTLTGFSRASAKALETALNG